MPPPQRSSRTPLTRADLPAELTPDTLRHLGLRTLRQLSQPDNGVLDADEQQQYDAALAELMRGTATRVNESLRRARRGGPGGLDPAMRRSYERTQQRLAEQVERARESFPELALDVPDEPPGTPPSDQAATATVAGPPDDVSPGALEHEVEQTSETLDMLERIASLQQQQLEHQESQLLGETRGLFFAFLVSVAVIIAGVAPLVEAEPHDRLLMVLWTLGIVVVAAVVYALVRWVQGRDEQRRADD